MPSAVRSGKQAPPRARLGRNARGRPSDHGLARPARRRRPQDVRHSTTDTTKDPSAARRRAPPGRQSLLRQPGLDVPESLASFPSMRLPALIVGFSTGRHARGQVISRRSDRPPPSTCEVAGDRGARMDLRQEQGRAGEGMPRWGPVGDLRIGIDEIATTRSRRGRWPGPGRSATRRLGSHAARKKAAVSASTSGYRSGILQPQCRRRPPARSTRQQDVLLPAERRLAARTRRRGCRRSPPRG
jgi:hypothetical protein